MSTRTDSPEQQLLYKVYSDALLFAEGHTSNSLEAVYFLESSFDDRQKIFDAWDKADQPAPHTQALVDFLRSYFGLAVIES